MFIGCTSRPTADPFNLGLERHAETDVYLSLDSADQPVDFGGGGATVVDDEVRVLLRDLCSSFVSTLEPRSLDQPPGRVTRRVLEHAAAVLAADGLSSGALGHPVRHLTPRSRAIPWTQLDPGTGHQCPLQGPPTQGRGPVAERQLPRRPLGRAAVWADALRGRQDLDQLCPPTAGVLVNGTADGARHPDCPLEAGQVVVGADPRQPHHLEPCLGEDTIAVDPPFAVDAADYQALDPGVGDQEIG